MKNRLQFRHHDDEIFGSREEALNYISGQTVMKDDDQFGYAHSLLAEPTILLYKVEGDDEPHVILAIGANNGASMWYNDNKFCIIDIDKTEAEIEEIWEKIEELIKLLSLDVIDSPSLNLSLAKTDDGMFLSGDVVTSTYRIADGLIKQNNLYITQSDDTNGDPGLFMYVKFNYNKDDETIAFEVSNASGGVDTTFVELPNNYLTGGTYSIEDESLHLNMKDGQEITVGLRELIDEWDTEGDASNTPIVLKKIHNTSPSVHHQHSDILSGDVRVDSDRPYNILEKTGFGKYLYVKGHANNIAYEYNGESMTVNDALNELKNIKISLDRTNMLQDRADGFFASTELDYISSKNTLVFKTTNVDGTIHTNEIQLNSVDFPIDDIYYDSRTETLIIKWRDQEGKIQTIKIPLTDMIDEWEVLNPGHTVTLTKVHKVSGKDQLSADVNILENEDNIIDVIDHKLIVKGTADNIKYNGSTVKDALDNLDQKIDDETDRAKDAERQLSDAVDAETNRAEDEENRIENKFDTLIGSGFTADVHENVTAKFEALSGKVDTVSGNVISEAERAISAETALQNAIDTEKQRAEGVENALSGAIYTEKSERINADNALQDAIAAESERAMSVEALLQSEIEAVSADSESSLKDIINTDHSIGIDKNDPVKPVVKVNISEYENNTIRLIQQDGIDGLYNFVDLTYDETHNKLTFTRSTSGVTDFTREIKIRDISVIEDIYYDPKRDELVIRYKKGEGYDEIRIPLAGLIDEWDVFNDVHSVVELTKTWDASVTKNILSAKVRVSSKEDNILTAVEEGAERFEHLYVSGAQISANTAAIEELTASANTLNDKVDELDAKVDELAEEISGATGGIEVISGRVDDLTASAETLDRKIGTGFTDNPYENVTAKFEALSGKVDTVSGDVITEKNRAISAETALQNAINAEKQRAEGVENALSGAIDTERAERISGDNALQAAITAEENRAMSAEAELANSANTLDMKIGTGFTASPYENVTFRFNELSGKVVTVSGDVITEKNRAISAETELNDAINAEISRATAKENELTDSATTANINIDKIYRTIGSGFTENPYENITRKFETLTTTVNNEITRSTEKDGALETALNNEITRATSAETVITTNLTNEIARAQGEELALNIKIDTVSGEVQDISGGTAELEAKIDQEIVDRKADVDAEEARAKAREDELEGMITGGTLSFDDSKSIDFVKTGTNVTAIVKRANSDDNIIMVPTEGSAEGIYASARLDYDTPTNTIKLTTSNGGVYEYQLAGATVIDTLYYDNESGELVITYHDGSGNVQTTRFPASELFNEWIVQNPSEKSAVELTKTRATEQGQPDELKARTLITDDRDGDGKPDEGSDNIIEIRNNGLYVCGSGITKNAEDIECLDNISKAIVRFLKPDQTIGDCGDELIYDHPEGDPHRVLSGASSMYEADEYLEQAIVDIQELMDRLFQGSETPTTHMYVEIDGYNKLLKNDVRLSHGIEPSQTTDDDLVITHADNGGIVERGKPEATGTNVLRTIDWTDYGMVPEVPMNGVYLSNEWNCGKYYQESTEGDEIAEMEAYGYGYLDNAKTDEDSSAMNYNYNNNVRL